MGIQKDIIEAEVRLKGMSESQKQLVELSSSYGTLAEKNKQLKLRMLEIEAQGGKGNAAWKAIREEMKKNTSEMGILDAKMGVLNSKLKYNEMTNKQLKRAYEDLQQQLNRTSKELDPKRWEELSNKMKEVQLQMDKTSSGGSTMQKWMGNIKEGIKGMLPVAGFAAAADLIRRGLLSIFDMSKIMQGDAVRSSVVLGNQLAYVESQADKLARKMGLTRREFVAATAATADLLIPLNFTREASAKMASQVTSLAGALNEWTGARYGVEEVSKRIQRAILGETDSLKELGIAIRLDSDEYRKSVKQKIESQKVSQEQAQALTIMEMLYQKSKDAQTAYTQNGNQVLRFQNAVSAGWREMKEKVTEYLITTSDQRLIKTANVILKQGDEISNTNKQIDGLLKRYEELKNKGSLTKDEQLEYNSAIKQLADFAPGAITQVDAYGNAMGISAGKIREAQEAHRLLNLEMQKDVAVSVTDKLKDRIKDANEAGYNTRGSLRTLNTFTKADWEKRSTETNIAGKGFTYTTPYEEKEIEGTRLKGYMSQTKQANSDIAKYVLLLQKLGKTNKEIAIEVGVSWDWLDKRVQSYMQNIPEDGGGGGNTGGGDKSAKYSLTSDEDFLKEKLNVKQRYRNGDIANEETYQKELINLELKYLQKRLATGVDKGKDKLDLQNEIADKQLSKKNGKTSKGYNVTEDESYIKDVIDIKKKYRDGDIADEDLYQQKLLEVEIKYLKQRLDANKDTAKDRISLENDLTDKEIQLKKKNEAIVEKIQKTNNKKDLQSIEDYFDDRERQYNKDIAKSKVFYEKQLEAAGSNKEERRKILDKQKKDELKITEDFLTESLRLLEKLNATGALPNIALIDSILSEEEKNEVLKRIQTILDAKSKLKVDNGKSAKESLVTPQAGGKDILGYSPDDWQGLFNNLKSGKFGIDEMAMGVSVLMSAYQAYGSMMTAIENRKLQVIEKNNNAEKAKLKKQLESKTISEKQYNDRVTAMDNDLEQKKADIQIKQARREKALGVMGAIVNTAVGITSALKLPWPLNLIIAGIVGAMGAAQIATILATPMPGRAKGGFLVQREQDGKYFDAEFQPKRRGFVSKPTVIVGEGDGEEWVANDKAVKNPTVAPILHLFDEAQRNGTIATIDMNQVFAERYSGRASGGSIGGGAVATPAGVDSSIVEVIQKSSDATEKLAKRLENPINAFVTLTGHKGLNETLDKYKTWEEDVNL